MNKTTWRLSCLAFAAGSLLLFSGCATMKTDGGTAMSLLPPAPSVAPQPAAVEPPIVTSSPHLVLKETPTFLNRLPEMPPRPTHVDDRIRRAEESFQLGRRLSQEGDIAAARKEFNRSLEILLQLSDQTVGRERIERKFEQLVEAIHRYEVRNLLPEIALEQEPSFDKSPLDEILQLTFPIDPKLRDQVTGEVQATVSQLPLELKDQVLSYINYFSSERGRPTIVNGLRRAGRYRPLISRILDEEGVPQELIFLAQAESGFLPRAISHKQATGMWQFVLLRGREYGLNQTPWSDDRLDPEKATRAAARHLRDLYHEFGDWYLALAAYNSGPGTVDRAVQRTGYADFWELRSRNVLPKETSNYIPIIVAMTIMAKNAKDYRLDDIDPDPALEYDTLQLTEPVHIALIADITDQPVQAIRDLNPALLKHLAPAGYTLRLPKGTSCPVASALELIPADKRTAWRMHRVDEGDTLEVVADRYRVSQAALRGANRTVAEALEPGDLIVVPAAPPKPEARAKAVSRRPVSRKPVSRRGLVARTTARR